MRVKKIAFLLCLFAVVLGCCFAYKVDARTPKPINSIATIIYDMQPPHEGMPHGVPSYYSWATKPRIGSNNPKQFKAMTAWGQLYEAAQGNPATNTRVQIKNIKAYYLSKLDNKWHLIQNSTKVEGAAYREDFSGNASTAANIRYESDGSVSVKAGNGYNYHFWPSGRAAINPYDVRGMFTTVQARLVVDNPKKRDDRSQARYLLNMGGDYWLNLTARWDNWKTNEDFGMGKFKYVTRKWRAFNMMTLPPNQIRRNPPPIE
ncbi:MULTISPECIES: hypothetical protein [unclassified Nostoc]|uniref:hypothetical protein n=1 Tax=unclassified Nostoc TaxID=2593658 RepID=UPI002AD4BB7D|nr:MULTISPECIES: hypothetical protein [unclassified Nostoc]MDZ8121397.1 hypothetical protein [Nostoc sp. CmiVER01]MDZ8224899.1 hypothetical protein [Nostoc sp. ChiVER01]